MSLPCFYSKPLLMFATLLAVACGGGGQESGEPSSQASSDIRQEPSLVLSDLRLTEADGVVIEIEYEVPEAQVRGGEYARLYGDKQKAMLFQRVVKGDLAGLVAYIEFENPAQAELVLIAMPDEDADEKHSSFSRQSNFIIAIETSASILSLEQAEAFAETVGSIIQNKCHEAYLRRGAEN